MRSTQIGAVVFGTGPPCNFNRSLKLGVGNAASLHLTAALKGNGLPGAITVNTLTGREQTKVCGVFYTDDVITEPLRFADGSLKVSPGTGSV